MNTIIRFLWTRCACRNQQIFLRVRPSSQHTLNLASRFSSEPIENDSSEAPGSINDSPSSDVPLISEEAEILRAFNTLERAQLYGYRLLSASLSKAVTDERETGGPFKDLRDLLRIKGMGGRTLERLRSEGLRPRGIKIKPPKRLAYAISEEEQISEEKLQVFETVLTMAIGLKQCAWLHVDRGRNVLDWQVLDLGDINAGKYHPAAYLKALQRILDETPRADLYILEHMTYGSHGKASGHVTVFLRTLQSILFGLLNSDYADTGELQCLSLSQQLVGKHLGLLIGTRRGSGRDIVQTLLEKAHNPLEEEKAVVKFRPQDSERWASSDDYEKEALANSVLEAVTFFDVFVEVKKRYSAKQD